MPITEKDRVFWKEVLSGARLAAKIGRTDLSRRINLHLTTISLIERGERLPSAEVILTWLEECGYSLMVAPSQTARAYSALSEDGVRMVWNLIGNLNRYRDEPEVIARASKALVEAFSPPPVVPVVHLPEAYRLRHPEKS